jgi:UDP-2,3-diacylglucosamine pyrophosphatase LpxH
MNTPQHYRSIFISDVHLGSRDAKAGCLLDFLRHSECDYLYLVGDIFDLWKLKKGWHWPPQNNTLIALVFAKARSGTRVIYIPGNHDEVLRDYCGGDYNGVELRRETIHQGADGQRYLVLHGDEFDCIVRSNQWLAHIGDGANDMLLWLNHWLNLSRRHLGLDDWSLSAFLKQQAKGAVNFISRYEQAVCIEATRRQVDGVICGHIHHAAQRGLGGCVYKNCGDWVESCTALVEDGEGVFEVIHWSAQRLDENAVRTAGTDDDETGRPVQAA